MQQSNREMGDPDVTLSAEQARLALQIINGDAGDDLMNSDSAGRKSVIAALENVANQHVQPKDD